MGENLVELLRDAADRAFPGGPVVFAYLFGSRATSKTHRDSDVDVAVYLDDSVPRERYLDLRLRLPGELGEAARVGDIDLLILNEASLPLAGRAVRDRLVIFSRDEPARVRYEGAIIKQFFDFEIHSQPLAEAILRQVAEGRS